MILKKGKRKIVFDGKTFYWYIRLPYIHIISEDKKLQLKYGFDKELCIGPQYIKDLLTAYFEKQHMLETPSK